MKLHHDSSFKAYIGIDWANSKHDICISELNSSEKEFSVLPHNVKSIEEWAQSLHRRFGSPIAVAVELSKGPIIYALQKYDFFVIFPVEPSILARYRKTFTPSGAKDDPTDAACAVELIQRYPERFKPLKVQSTEMRTLTLLVEQRRQFVDEVKRNTNRLRNALKQYYPQVLEWFDRIDTHIFCDFIATWPTLEKVKKARRNTLMKFFKQNRVNSLELIDWRIKSIKDSMPLTSDESVIIPHSMQAQVLITQLRVTLEGINQFDEAIEKVASKHVDYSLFRSLPGAGPHLAPRLLSAFGEQRERFQTASDLQKYSGIAPVTERSGQKEWVHWRWQCPKFLRQTFVELAGQTINKSFWAGEFYRQQRAKGCSYQSAVRALAYKWIRILFRCWKNRQPYDESTYLKALERRGSPLMKRLVEE